jgi:hypothetical protein
LGNGSDQHTQEILGLSLLAAIPCTDAMTKVFGMEMTVNISEMAGSKVVDTPWLGQWSVFESAGSRTVIGCRDQYPRAKPPKGFTAN